jgi:hypothetical protein
VTQKSGSDQGNKTERWTMPTNRGIEKLKCYLSTYIACGYDRITKAGCESERKPRST